MFTIAELVVSSYPTIFCEETSSSAFLRSLDPSQFQDIEEYDVFQATIANPTVLGLFNKMVRLAAEAFHREIPRETLEAATYEVETATRTLSFSPFHWGYENGTSAMEIMNMVSRKCSEFPYWNVAEQVQVFAMTVRTDKATSEFLACLDPDDVNGFEVDIAHPTPEGLYWRLISLAAAAYKSGIPPATLQHVACDVETADSQMCFYPFMWGYSDKGVEELKAEIEESLEECCGFDPCSSKGSA